MSAVRADRTGRASAPTTTTGRVATLEAQGLVYPCFCSPQELELSRRAQLAAGRPPRYAGTCASLPAAEVARRVEAEPARRCGSACRPGASSSSTT